MRNPVKKFFNLNHHFCPIYIYGYGSFIEFSINLCFEVVLYYITAP
jgi:hypothetical protein